MTLKEFEGKHCFVKLNSNKVYTGIIKEVEFLGNNDDDAPCYLFSMIDKFGNFIGFPSNEIKLIEEQKIELEDEEI